MSLPSPRRKRARPADPASVAGPTAAAVTRSRRDGPKDSDPTDWRGGWGLGGAIDKYRGILALAVGLLVLGAGVLAGTGWIGRAAQEPNQCFSDPSGAWTGETVDSELVVDRDGVSRRTKIVGLPLAVVGCFLSGQSDGQALVDGAGATWGKTSDGGQCLPISNPTVQVSISTVDQIAATSVVESNLPLIDRTLQLDICFPRGAPPVGALGALVLTVRDYNVTSISPNPEPVAFNAGVKSYRWTHIEPGGRVTVQLSQDALGFVRQLTRLSLSALAEGLPSLAVWLVLIVFLTLPSLLVRWAIREAKAVNETPIKSAYRVALLAALPATIGLIGSVALGFGTIEASLGHAVGDQQIFGYIVAAEGVGLFLFFGLCALSAAAVWWLARSLGRQGLADFGAIVCLAAALLAALTSVGALVIALGSGTTLARSAVWLETALVGALVVGTGLSVLRPSQLRRALLLAVGGLVLWIAIPNDATRPFAGENVADFVWSVSERMWALTLVGPGLLALAVAGAAYAMWQRDSWRDRVAGTSGSEEILSHDQARRDAATVALAQALFAAVIVGTSGVVAGLPVTLPIAWFAFPVLVWSPRVVATLRTFRDGLSQPQLRHELMSRAEASDRGDALKHEQDAAPQDPEEWLSDLGERASFLFGPSPSPWENARRALRYGFVLSVIPLAVYVALSAKTLIDSNVGDLLLGVALRAAGSAATWLALAFFFGMFYQYLGETTGLRKGLRVALVVILITLPLRIYDAAAGYGSPAVIIFDAVSSIVFLGVLGLLFDMAVLGVDIGRVSTLRPALRAVVRTSGLGGALVFGGSVATVVGTAALGLLTGEVTRILSALPFLGGQP